LVPPADPYRTGSPFFALSLSAQAPNNNEASKTKSSLPKTARLPDEKALFKKETDFSMCRAISPIAG
jgi:hypothetical protein